MFRYLREENIPEPFEEQMLRPRENAKHKRRSRISDRAVHMIYLHRSSGGNQTNTPDKRGPLHRQGGSFSLCDKRRRERRGEKRGKYEFPLPPLLSPTIDHLPQPARKKCVKKMLYSLAIVFVVLVVLSATVTPMQICSPAETSILHGVLGRPLPGGAVVAGPVRLQKMSDVGDERIVGVGVGEEGADTEQDLGDG